MKTVVLLPGSLSGEHKKKKTRASLHGLSVTPICCVTNPTR